MAYFYAGLLLLSLYALKFVLLRGLSFRPLAIVLYCELLILSLTYVHVLILEHCHHPDADECVCWIGVPVQLLVIPTASFLLDLHAKTLPRLIPYAFRTAVEVFLLIPIWSITWVCIEVFILEWIWI